MSIPSTVWILGFQYKIVQRQEDGAEWCHAMKAFAALAGDGFCDSKWHIIYVNPDRCEDMQRETLLHEIFHAIDFVLNLDDWDAPPRTMIGQTDAGPSTQHTEAFLQQHNRVLLSVLRDPRNKDVAAWLLQESVK